MTTYKVYRKHTTPKTPENGTASVRVIGGYELIGEYDGNTPKAAIKAAVLAMTPDQQAKAGTETFGATPAGSWYEHSPNVTTETKVTFA